MYVVRSFCGEEEQELGFENFSLKFKASQFLGVYSKPCSSSEFGTSEVCSVRYSCKGIGGA